LQKIAHLPEKDGVRVMEKDAALGARAASFSQNSKSDYRDRVHH
jgi:hypothetical protein